MDTPPVESHPEPPSTYPRLEKHPMSKPMAQCLLRRSRAVLDGHRPCPSEPISWQKPLTGEPDAGNPPVRFGGRGGESHLHPYPYSVRCHSYGTHSCSRTHF